MSDNTHALPSSGRRTHRLRAGGFTLVSLTVSIMLSGIILASGWMSYTNMLRQWKIGNAERLMDQYAAAAMQEFTNDLSWSWATSVIQGNERSSRWKFRVDDLIDDRQEYPHQLLDQLPYGRLRDGDRFITVSFQPTRGILLSGRPPAWAGDYWHPQYQFVGNAPRRDQVRTMDRRDRMTLEKLRFEYNSLERWNTNSIQDRVRRQGLVKLTMTMHYTYRGNNDLGVFSDYYVRERQYQTQIFQKNWDVYANAYRDSLVSRAR